MELVCQVNRTSDSFEISICLLNFSFSLHFVMVLYVLKIVYHSGAQALSFPKTTQDTAHIICVVCRMCVMCPFCDICELVCIF